MPVDQNDLLIFKNRPEEKKPQKAKKQGEQQLLEEQKPAEVQPPQKVAAPAPTPPLPVMQQAPAQSPPSPPQQPVYQVPQQAVQQNQPTQAPSPTPQPPQAQPQESDEIPYRPTPRPQMPDLPDKAKYGSKKARIRQMKELAATMDCELHPWRKAYAICDYCKRAFCYEDIVEEAGTFYCVDDMDKIPASAKATKVVSYGRISTLAVLCFVLVLPTYLALEYTQLELFISQFLTAQITGVPVYTVFLANATFSAGALIAILSFVAGVMVLLGSKKGARNAMMIGVAAGVLFIYTYATTLIIYPAIYAAIEMVAVLMLLYSRSYYETAALQAESVGIPVMDTHPSI